MIHAFGDEARKDAVRALARDVGQLETRVAELEARCKRLEEALVSISEYWNRDNNERAMEDACWHALETAVAALTHEEAKP